jgi:hypothetical protein
MQTYEVSDKQNFFIRTGQKSTLEGGNGLKEGLENTLLFAPVALRLFAPVALRFHIDT